MILKSRKERIIEAKKDKARKRKVTFAGATLVAAITASSFTLTANEAKALSGTYTVKEGDSLYRISRENKVSINELKQVNKLTSDKIYIGQELDIPTKVQIAENSPKSTAVYTVAPGDTLWGIANRFGISVEELKRQNNLKKDMVLINQKLIIQNDIFYKKAKIVGAVDNNTVEFVSDQNHFVLMIPYGTAQNYQNLSGNEVIVSYKNGAVIQIQ